MTGVEPGSSGIVSNRAVNCATTTDFLKKCCFEANKIVITIVESMTERERNAQHLNVINPSFVIIKTNRRCTYFTLFDKIILQNLIQKTLNKTDYLSQSINYLPCCQLCDNNIYFSPHRDIQTCLPPISSFLFQSSFLADRSQEQGQGRRPKPILKKVSAPKLEPLPDQLRRGNSSRPSQSDIKYIFSTEMDTRDQCCKTILL